MNLTKSAKNAVKKNGDTSNKRKTNYIGEIMKTLTVKQLKKACDENLFILARFKSGQLIGINTKVAMLGYERKKYKHSQTTNYISFIPCNFQEYINFKIPYISK